MRIIFFGTPHFALKSLEALLSAGEKIVAVVTQPDRPKGRGLHLEPSPVKELALRQGLEVLQPENIKDAKFWDQLRGFKPDLGVVVAYGKILPAELLKIPRLGFINVHASLLPKYRGASPIQHALLDGEPETGVTILQVTPTLDAGDILLQEKAPIDAEDNAGTLEKWLADMGGKALVKAVELIKEGKTRAIPQDGTKVTYARRFQKNDGLIDWKRSPVEIHNFVRGMTPWPGAYTMVKGKQVKLLRTILSEGKLRIIEVQPEGKRPMSYDEYVRGHGEII